MPDGLLYIVYIGVISFTSWRVYRYLKSNKSKWEKAKCFLSLLAPPIVFVVLLCVPLVKKLTPPYFSTYKTLVSTLAGIIYLATIGLSAWIIATTVPPTSNEANANRTCNNPHSIKEWVSVVASLMTVVGIFVAWQTYEKSIEAFRPRIIVQDFIINVDKDTLVIAAGDVVLQAFRDDSPDGFTAMQNEFTVIALEDREDYLKSIQKAKREHDSVDDSKSKELTQAIFDNQPYLLYDFCDSMVQKSDMLLLLDVAEISLRNDGNPINRLEVQQSLTLFRDGTKDSWFEMDSGSYNAFFFTNSNDDENAQEITIPIAFLLPYDMVKILEENKSSNMVEGIFDLFSSIKQYASIVEHDGKTTKLSLYEHPELSALLKGNFDIGTIALKALCYAEDGNKYIYSLFFELDPDTAVLLGINSSYRPYGSGISKYIHSLSYEWKRLIYNSSDGQKSYTCWDEFEKHYEMAMTRIDQFDALREKIALINPFTLRKRIDKIPGFGNLISSAYNTYIKQQRRYASASFGSSFSTVAINVLNDCGLIDMNRMGLASEYGRLVYYATISDNRNALLGSIKAKDFGAACQILYSIVSSVQPDDKGINTMELSEQLQNLSQSLQSSDMAIVGNEFTRYVTSEDWDCYLYWHDLLFNEDEDDDFADFFYKIASTFR